MQIQSLARSRIIHFGLAAVVSAFACAAQAVTYSVTELGSLGGTRTIANAVNSSGQVAGYSYTPGHLNYHAFITGPNGIGFFDLGTLPGTINSVANGVNDAGRVVGTSYSAFSVTSPSIIRAFITGPNGADISVLDYLGGTGIYFGFQSVSNWGQGINNTGQVTGASNVVIFGSLRVAGFVTGANGVGVAAAATPTLALRGGLDINASGQIAGLSINSRASFTDSNGTTTEIALPITLSSEARAINDLGQVVGIRDVGDLTQSFITAPGGTELRALGTLGGSTFARDINNAGQVVGTSNVNEPRILGPRAFITGPDGIGITDLNSLVTFANRLPVTFTEASAINDSGQIAAIGSNGRSYLLTPVPEPAALSMLIAGLGLLVGAVRRRRAITAGLRRSI